MRKCISFLKQQPVLLAAFFAALLSMCFVTPDRQYLSYCNTAVLIQLFCLMLTIAGFRSIGGFERLTQALLQRVNGLRRLGILLVNLCFFLSMLVTNDVALLTLVPLTLLLVEEKVNKTACILLIVLETAAANLGSMMTPIGNPQNLYLYAVYQLDAMSFLKGLLPLGICSYIILMGLCFLLKNEAVPIPAGERKPLPKLPMGIYSILFLLCIGAVFRICPSWVCLVAALLLPLLTDRRLYGKVDYALLATFVCFFVFVGNIGRMEAVKDFFSGVMAGNEVWISALLSQVISNVPAAVMLAGFTEQAEALLRGVNVGGLGTPIASLASLISYQFYSKSKGAENGRYLGIFSAVNFGMLAILLGMCLVLQK